MEFLDLLSLSCKEQVFGPGEVLFYQHHGKREYYLNEEGGGDRSGVGGGGSSSGGSSGVEGGKLDTFSPQQQYIYLIVKGDIVLY